MADPAPRKSLKNAGGNRFAHVDLPAEHPPHGQHELTAAFLFHNVAPPAGPEDALGVKNLIVHGDDEY